jgi:hypothetical protein
MSFRDTAAAPLAAAFFALSGLVLSGSALAEESPPAQPAASPVLSAEACLRADLAGVPPPAAADCAEYQARLEQQAKRMDILAKIAASRQQIDKQSAPPPSPAKPPDPAQHSSAAPPPALDDRVLEVFGDQASIRYRGGDLLVRQGQSLPQGGRVEQVSLQAVVIVEGGSRRALPFYIGERK